MSRVPVRVFDTPDDIGTYVAERILRGVADARDAGQRYLLGLPTGRTPRPVYTAMAAALMREPRSLAHVTLVMMDEYLLETADGYAYAMAAGAPSCHAFTRDEILGPLNAALPQGFRVGQEQVWFPDPRDPAAYDGRIAAAGGIDFFLIASGAGDGHVAFNPPGSALDSRSRIVALSEQTRRDNLVTFPGLGIATIVEARDAVMVAWGAGKRETVRRMIEASQYEPDWPATLVHECAATELLVDRAAAP